MLSKVINIVSKNKEKAEKKKPKIIHKHFIVFCRIMQKYVRKYNYTTRKKEIFTKMWIIIGLST